MVGRHALHEVIAHERAEPQTAGFFGAKRVQTLGLLQRAARAYNVELSQLRQLSHDRNQLVELSHVAHQQPLQCGAAAADRHHIEAVQTARIGVELEVDDIGRIARDNAQRSVIWFIKHDTLQVAAPLAYRRVPTAVDLSEACRDHEIESVAPASKELSCKLIAEHGVGNRGVIYHCEVGRAGHSSRMLMQHRIRATVVTCSLVDPSCAVANDLWE